MDTNTNQMGGEGKTCGNCGKCPCPHHKIVPAAITLIGVAFLLQALGWLSMGAVAITWPILVIIIGLMKLMRNKCKCC